VSAIAREGVLFTYLSATALDPSSLPDRSVNALRSGPFAVSSCRLLVLLTDLLRLPPTADQVYSSIPESFTRRAIVHPLALDMPIPP
jgi:hypothetical protein